jgi:hypothetical protein
LTRNSRGHPKHASRKDPRQSEHLRAVGSSDQAEGSKVIEKGISFSGVFFSDGFGAWSENALIER